MTHPTNAQRAPLVSDEIQARRCARTVVEIIDTLRGKLFSIDNPDAYAPAIERAITEQLAAARAELAEYRDALRDVLGYIVGSNHIDAVLAFKQHPYHESGCCVCRARALLAKHEPPR